MKISSGYVSGLAVLKCFMTGVLFAVATLAAPVEIHSTPSKVSVWQNDVLLGQTPCTVDFATEGQACLEFRATGCEPLQQTVELGKLTADGVLTVTVRPRQDAVVTLRCESQPAGAEVYLDGEQRGITPLELPGVPRRAVELRFSRAERETVIRQLDLSKGEGRRVVSVILPSLLESNYRRMIQAEPYNIHHYADLGHHLMLEGAYANAVETLATGLRLTLDGKIDNAQDRSRLWSEINRIVKHQYDYGNADIVAKARLMVYELLMDLYTHYADSKWRVQPLYVELITCAREMGLKDTAEQVLERGLSKWPQSKLLLRMKKNR